MFLAAGLSLLYHYFGDGHSGVSLVKDSLHGTKKTNMSALGQVVANSSSIWEYVFIKQVVPEDQMLLNQYKKTQMCLLVPTTSLGQLIY